MRRHFLYNGRSLCGFKEGTTEGWTKTKLSRKCKFCVQILKAETLLAEIILASREPKWIAAGHLIIPDTSEEAKITWFKREGDE